MDEMWVKLKKSMNAKVFGGIAVDQIVSFVVLASVVIYSVFIHDSSRAKLSSLTDIEENKVENEPPEQGRALNNLKEIKIIF